MTERRRSQQERRTSSEYQEHRLKFARHLENENFALCLTSLASAQATGILENVPLQKLFSQLRRMADEAEDKAKFSGKIDAASYFGTQAQAYREMLGKLNRGEESRRSKSRGPKTVYNSQQGQDQASRRSRRRRRR